jgi:hypothetical protein
VSRRLLVLATPVGLAVLVLLAGTGLGWWNGAPGGGEAPSTPLALQTALTPNPAFYGDVVLARVAVQYDPKIVRRGTIRVATSFDPYVETARPAVSAFTSGGTAGIVYRYTIQCVTDGCLPLTKPKQLKFPPAVVTGSSSSGTVRATAPWRPLYVASRLSPADVRAGQHFHRSSTVLPASYAVSPGLLETLLVIVALILGAGGVALLVLELRRFTERRRARAAGIQGRRALALAYVRDSAGRADAADRRKALGLLAETLAEEGEAALAASAGDVAWAETPPTPDQTLELVNDVERVSPVKEPSS